MANRRIEMQEYRSALYRMRQRESNRSINRDHVLGRRKLANLRSIAEQENWLDPSVALPTERVLLEAIKARDLANKSSESATEYAPLIHADSQSNLVQYAQIIEAWFKQGVNGKAIYNALVRNQDYKGHYSSVRRYLKKLRVPKIDATMILDFEPGEACQVDFGAGPLILDQHSGKLCKTWFFVMTMCFSRHQYVEFVRDQTVETWLSCHHHAFRHFGGVPKRVIIDNPKCAITRAVTDDVLVQRAYAECAEGYSFLISPCPPADPAKKGRVEAGVKYVKGNFLPTREFCELADVNRQVMQWVMQEAGRRIHGTTHEQPLALFETERAYLQALPDRTPDVCTWVNATVHRDAHVQFDSGLYSVPYTLIGQKLTLRVSSQIVDAFTPRHELVATHPRGRRKGYRSTVDEHLPPAAQAWLMHTPQYCLEQAKLVGPACLGLVTRMFGDKVLDRLRMVQGLLRLGQRFGAERLEGACVLMQDVDVVSTRTVRMMLEKDLDKVPVQDVPHSPVYQGHGRFYRHNSAPTEFELH